MARSTVILGVIAAALLAFILLHERDLLSSAQLEQRKNRVLTTFVRDRVSRLEVVRGGQTLVLERAPDPDPEHEGVLGPWKQIAPMQVAVDQEAVDVLLGELEWLQPRRVLEGLTDDDRKRFGFTKPRIEVRITIGKQRSVLLVGGDEPTGIGLYASGDDPDVAYIVGKDLFEALDHDAGHFHTKELHSGIFLFASSAVIARFPQGEERAEIRDGTWWIDAPVKSILASAEVESVIKGLDQLRAKRFVATAIEGPLSYGLDAPSLVLTVERGRSTDADKTAATPITLRVGAVCDAHADEKYVQVNGGPVMCAATADLDKLARPLSELIDRSPFPADPERVTEVTLQTPSRTIVVTKADAGWRYRVVAGGKQTSAGDADREAVGEWMKALRGLQFTVRDQGVPAGAELVTFKVKSSGTADVLVVRVVTGGDGVMHVSRAGETEWLRFDASSAAPLTPVVARFRSLALIDDADATLTAVTVARVGVTESAERVGDRWLLKAPIDADADSIALSDIAHLMARLSAVRFVADAPEAQHGLDRTAVRVTFKLGTNERVLLLGAPSDDGIFSQLVGDGSVFVVPTRVLETVSSGLLAKTSLATSIEHIRSLTLKSGGGTYTVTREGARFVVATSIPGATSPSSAADRVARLRAEAVVHYGAALAGEGFASPRLTISVELTAADGQPLRHELNFGASTGPAETPQVFARRSGLDATLTVSQAAFEHLVELTR